ncbi:MAG: hypothetical protein ACREIF_07760 [Chthoniobacterales bacterium]
MTPKGNHCGRGDDPGFPPEWSAEDFYSARVTPDSDFTKGSEHYVTRYFEGAAVKVAIARRLREETTMPLMWIAAQLRMGTWTHLNRLLHARR